MRLAGSDEDWSHGAVIAGLLSALLFQAGTVGTMNFLRSEVPGAVQRDERGVRHGAKGFPESLLTQRLENVIIKREEFFRRDWIEHWAEGIVGGDLLDLKEAWGVARSLGLLHRFLIGEEGRRLGKKDREGAQAEVLHGVVGVVAGAPIGPGGEDLAQLTGLRIPSVVTPGASLRWKSGISGWS